MSQRGEGAGGPVRHERRDPSPDPSHVPEVRPRHVPRGAWEPSLLRALRVRGVEDPSQGQTAKTIGGPPPFGSATQLPRAGRASQAIGREPCPAFLERQLSTGKGVLASRAEVTLGTSPAREVRRAPPFRSERIPGHPPSVATDAQATRHGDPWCRHGSPSMVHTQTGAEASGLRPVAGAQEVMAPRRKWRRPSWARSIAWTSRRPPEPQTRVRIPAGPLPAFLPPTCGRASIEHGGRRTRSPLLPRRGFGSVRSDDRPSAPGRRLPAAFR